jgi:hypothetical protein
MSNKIFEEQNTIKNKIFKVAKVINNNELVLNAGYNKGIKKGYKFLIYSLGEEILDPDTGESLGKLETSKGIGKVIHVQEKMSTIKTYGTPAKKTISTQAFNTYLNLINQGEDNTAESEPEILPFENPQKGDLAKYIS